LNGSIVTALCPFTIWALQVSKNKVGKRMEGKEREGKGRKGKEIRI
jgi:hypothetical protein